MKGKISSLLGALAVAGALAGGATAAASPSVSTGAATHIKQMSAVLNGTVNPNSASTSYYFQWGLTTTFGVNSRLTKAGSGTKPMGVKTTAVNLIPGTVYHYRLLAVSRFGTTAGSDRTFKTTGPPPATVQTGPAANVTTSAATLTGVLNPNGAATNWQFQYGLTTSYTATTNGGALSSGKTPVVVSEPITGLARGTIFHYRLVAYHGAKVSSVGADGVFMTEPSPRPVPTLTTSTQPGRRRHTPYVFTTSGHVGGPSWIPGTFDCTGYVAVRFYLGRRDLTFTLLPVAPNCTFSGQTAFSHLPGRGAANRRVKLTVFTRFHGNGYLTPRRGRARVVSLG